MGNISKEVNIVGQVLTFERFRFHLRRYSMGNVDKIVMGNLPHEAEENSQDIFAHLLQKAKNAMQHAVAPSSGFKVGTALLGKSGTVYTGCNIESPVYLGLCAERLALFKGLSEGEQEFQVLAVVCKDNIPCPPCGTCRQLLWEFVPFLQIVLFHSNGTPQVHSIQDLLPAPFERGNQSPFRESSLDLPDSH